MTTIKLEYLKGSKEMAASFGMVGFDSRLWNVIKPQLPNYNYSLGQFPSLGVAGLRDNHLLSVGV